MRRTPADRALTPATLRKRRQRAREAATRDVEFVRADWALYLDPRRLPQKAGCPPDRLRAMILKELADNALDAGADVTLDRIDPDAWVVADDGPGLDRERVQRLFAVDRPMVSTKLLRRPTRGAIGNGLRVVTGGVLASGGRLTIESRGGRYVLDVDRRTGATVVVEEDASEVVAGTRVTVAFGPALPSGEIDGWMAELAVHCAGPAARPMRSHPSWYDEAAFAELVHAAEPGTTVAGIAGQFGIRLDDDRPAVEARLDLLAALAGAPPRLLPLGADRFDGCHAKESRAEGIPVLVEAWATAVRCPPSHGRGTVTLLVNRSPVASPVRIALGGDKRLGIWGCNLNYAIERVSPGARYEVVLAVTSPVVPVTTEGKEPDLKPLWDTIEPALAKAMRKARHSTAAGLRKNDIKRAYYAVTEKAYLKASAGNTLYAGARQVWYVVRPLALEILGSGVKFDYNYFLDVLAQFMAEHSDLTREWKLSYDPRGHLTEPHTGRVIPVGTLQVRDYLASGPGRTHDLVSLGGTMLPTTGAENRFGTLLYLEKEGFDPLLEQARIGERFDCAIMSTKGMSVTAARLVVDRLAQEGLKILVAHDFDRSGAAIAWTLGHSNWRYDFEADPGVVDIGLTLDEALAMGLQDEAAPDAGPGEDKLREYGLGEKEIDFLVRQGRRFELNAMTSDQFVAWLEGKLREHGAGKVVPEATMLERQARRLIARRLAADKVRLVIEAAEAEAAGVALPDDLRALVRREHARDPALPWEEALVLALVDVTPEAGS